MEKPQTSMAADKTMEKAQSSMDELPNVILMDILSRLPIKYVMQSMLVCKSFEYVISKDAEFSTLHLLRSCPELIMCTPGLEKVILVDWHADRADELNLQLDNLKLVNSCCGLLCLYPLYVYEPIRILNPVTLEFLIIPSPRPNPVLPTINGENSSDFMCVGLGYSSTTDQYKVLMFKMNHYSNGEKDFITLVYTLGTSSWRRIPVVCPINELSTDFVSASHNGSLHWLMNERTTVRYYDSMSAFDFTSEQFTQTKLPPPFHISMSTYRPDVHVLSLSVFQGFLTIFLLDEDQNICVWMMTESESESYTHSEERWSLKMVISTLSFCVPAESIQYSFPVKFIFTNQEPSLIFVVNNLLITTKMESISTKFWMVKDDIPEKLIFSNDNLLSNTFMHDPILLPLKELVRGVNKVHRLKPTGRKVWRRFNNEWIISPVQESTELGGV